jgi:hypothetical protein
MEGIVENWNQAEITELLKHLHFEFSQSRIITTAELVSATREILGRMARLIKDR